VTKYFADTHSGKYFADTLQCNEIIMLVVKTNFI